MSDSLDSRQLPVWFVRPDSVIDEQRTLFASQLSDVLATLRVSADELNRWHQRGWVSFDWHPSQLMESKDYDEIEFVRDVVRSGLSDAQIECLFDRLPRPMNFAPDRVAYSFSLGWVAAVPPPPLPDVIEIVDEHLDDWLDNLDVDLHQGRLVNLRDRINTLLESACSSANDLEDDELETP